MNIELKLPKGHLATTTAKEFYNVCRLLLDLDFGYKLNVSVEKEDFDNLKKEFDHPSTKTNADGNRIGVVTPFGFAEIYINN